MKAILHTPPKPSDPIKQKTGEGCSGAICYRLLDHNDMIRADDEFLEDDCVTWTLIGIQHRWNVGCYWHTALKPMRRILGDNGELTCGEGGTQNEN